MALTGSLDNLFASNTGGTYTPGPYDYLRGSVGAGVGFNQSLGSTQSTGASTSYIPDYSQTPILNEIAQYSRSMAPQVYQWGMDQFNKNQGNIDTMMRNAMSYSSPQRIAQEMGMAQSGVMQGAEAGRQNAVRDLQSYGIDPSAGRYAGLDTANRVMSGAAAAGAGNQQRMATQAAGNAMQNQAIAASNANVQTGYGASNAMNQLLGTASQLKYSPLGTISANQSSGQNVSFGGSGGSGSGGSGGGALWSGGTRAPMYGGPGNVGVHAGGLAKGGPVEDDATTGGFVSNDLSPTNGSATDDVRANLNAGEFVIPKDVAAWKGQEFFYKLMAQSRKMRAMGGGEGDGGGEQASIGYGAA